MTQDEELKNIQVDCRYFNGYKPCGKSSTCDTNCPHKNIPTETILVIHLEALGAVLRATSILPAIKRNFPNAHITWVTQAPAQAFFFENPLVDRVLTTKTEDLLQLSALNFDKAFVVDKSLKANGILKQTSYKKLYGFTNTKYGAIVPATPAGEELWQLGLDNHKKFFVNQKAETQLMIEALELGPFQRDEYQFFFSAAEKKKSQERRRRWSKDHQKLVIGLNTGCSTVIPYKKLSINEHRELIFDLIDLNLGEIVLLGGPEDKERNLEIARGIQGIHLSNCEGGLRDGLVSVDACDLVVSGDSLGMHMAIARQKWVVAWFGPTCAQEIDLYERGVHVITQASCHPCWKRQCDKEVMCYDLVDRRDILRGLQKGIDWHQKNRQKLSKNPGSYTSRQPSSVICS